MFQTGQGMGFQPQGQPLMQQPGGFQPQGQPLMQQPATFFNQPQTQQMSRTTGQTYQATTPSGQQVQWSLDPYFAAGATESKSVVLRSIPEDFFKGYLVYFTQLSGKYNGALRHPTDTNSRLPGVIFPNSKADAVRELIQRILTGQVTPQASHGPSQQTISYQQPSAIQGQPNQFMMTAFGIPQNPTPGFSSALPGPSSTVSISTLGGQINPRMQTITTIKPVAGETIHLVVEGQRYPMIIKSVETSPNTEYVVGATVEVGGQLSSLKLDPNFHFKIPGYATPHSVEL